MTPPAFALTSAHQRPFVGEGGRKNFLNALVNSVNKPGEPRRSCLNTVVEFTILIKFFNRVNVFFRKRIVRAGYQKAIVATAHKILQVVYYVLKNQTPYQEEYPAKA